MIDPEDIYPIEESNHKYNPKIFILFFFILLFVILL